MIYSDACNVPGDLNWKYWPGQRVRLQQAGSGQVEATRGSAGALDAFATLSTAANSEVNKEAMTKIGISSGISMRRPVGLSDYVLDLAAKGTYCLNCKTGQASISSVAFKGASRRLG